VLRISGDDVLRKYFASWTYWKNGRKIVNWCVNSFQGIEQEQKLVEIH
jgi:hypothetical protein